MTSNARPETRRKSTGWKKHTFRTIRVAYTVSKFGIAMMAPAHAQPHCVAVPFIVDCKAASTQTPPPAVWLP
jgi:hypothetical protein